MCFVIEQPFIPGPQLGNPVTCGGSVLSHAGHALASDSESVRFLSPTVQDNSGHSGRHLGTHAYHARNAVGPAANANSKLEFNKVQTGIMDYSNCFATILIPQR